MLTMLTNILIIFFKCVFVPLSPYSNNKELLLCLGTVKGNLILYDHKIGRKVSILGKHSRKILCGCWSLNTNYLAMGGAENTVTVSFMYTI